MNRIYKVIWSKVKHQYVVVSELAHRDGKRSSAATTSKATWRALAAVLMLTGSLAAVPYTGYALDGGTATESQYIAIAVVQGVNDRYKDEGRYPGTWDDKWVTYGDTRTFGDYTYVRQTVKVNGAAKEYWVREGYDITATQGERYPGINEGSDYIIDAKKNEDYAAESDKGLLQAYQTTTNAGKITTLTGVNIEDLNTGVYGGAANDGGVNTPNNFGYHIQVGDPEIDDGYLKVSNDLDGTGTGDAAGAWGNTNFDTYFSHNVTLQDNGTYAYTNRQGVTVEVPINKIYSIDGQLGVFTDAQGNLYTGDVYGDNNEILLSGVGEDNQIYTYWGTKINDPTQTIGNMTVGQYNLDRVELQNQSKAYHGDDIKDITVSPNENGGGSFSFNRVGKYNKTTGEYEAADPVGTITVKNTTNSGNHEDVAIEFSNGTDSFTVQAGSKVEGTTGEASGDTLTGLSINGVEYKLGGGKTYTDGDGIAINNEVISVDYGNGLAIENGKLVAKAGDNVTIDENGISAKNTTLDVAASTSAPIANGYGKDYKVVDTDGNTVNISDVASATKLEEVAGEAGKHTKVFTNDENLSVENTAAEGEAANYEVTLKKDLNVTSVNAGGTVISSNGLSIGKDTYVSSEGLNANSKKITNVATGTEDTDAVNVAQLEKYVGDNATYTEGDGININNKVISVDAGKGLTIENGKLVAKAGNNVTIDENGISAKNTTLDVAASTSAPIANGYGKDYKVVDTDGNTVNISDVASATKLEEVAGEAGKHTKVFTNDENLSVENTAAEGEAANYEVTLKKDLNVTSVNAGGTVISSNGLSIGKDTYVSSEGLNANSKKITNVATGTEDTDAVNVAQLEKYVGDNATYTDGDGIAINNKVISVDYGNGLTIADGKLVAKAGENVTIDENGISAKDTTLDVANSTSTPLGTSVDNVYGQSFVIADTAGNIITIDDIASATKLQEVDSLAVKYGTKDGEVDYSTIQLMKPYTSEGHSGGTTITNVAYADINGDGGAAVNVDLLKDTVSAAKTEMAASDQHLIENQETGSNGAYTVNDKNEVNLGVGTIDKDGKVTQTSTVTIKDVASASDLGDVTQIHDDLKNKDENGNSIDTSVVDAVNNLDDKVGDGDFSDTTYAKNETGDTSVTDAIHNLDDAINSATTIAGQHSSVHAGSNITVTPGTNPDFEGGKDYVVSLNDHITLGDKEQGTYVDVNGEAGTVEASGNITAGSFSTGNIAINKDNSGTINGLSNTKWDANKITTGQAATEDQLKAATEAAVQYDRNDKGEVDKGSISLGYIDNQGKQQYTQIHNVAAGSAPTDAVNVSQLSAVGNLAVNNYNNIQVLNGSINKLDNRIDRVGAGAAALAALHPLDFDPDAKWDFAAGYGNYRGANAVAVGAYYRPNEDVMFSVGGSMGGGENMVNAGVSLKIGAGNSGVTTSRVAMAKEIKAMRDVVAKQDAQIQKLTAMVNALVGVQAEPDTTTMFPDVPENHWAYEAVASMAKSGLVEGYPDGEFKGDRTMTRYEFAQIIQNAIQKGAEVDARLVQEFKPELEYFHIATVAKDKDGNPTIERVRAN